MRSYGPLYVGTLKYYHRDALPIVEKGWTQESELPFRKGSCFVFRFPKTYPGFYIGFWHPGSKMAEYDEAGAEARLSQALGIRDMGLTPDDIEEWNV